MIRWYQQQAPILMYLKAVAEDGSGHRDATEQDLALAGYTPTAQGVEAEPVGYVSQGVLELLDLGASGHGFIYPEQSEEHPHALYASPQPAQQAEDHATIARQAERIAALEVQLNAMLTRAQEAESERDAASPTPPTPAPTCETCDHDSDARPICSTCTFRDVDEMGRPCHHCKHNFGSECHYTARAGKGTK